MFGGGDGGGGDADLGGLQGALGGIQDFQGDFGDFANFDGDFSNLGNFFDVSQESQDALAAFQGIDVGELGDIGTGELHSLAQDADYFALQELGGDYVSEIVGLFGDQGIPDWDGSQFAGALNALGAGGDDGHGQVGLLAGDALAQLEGSQFGLLSQEGADALALASLFDIEPGGSIGDNLALYGDDAHNLLGAASHDLYFENADFIDDVFASIDFNNLDLGQSALSGDDIGGLIAALGGALGDQDDQHVLSALALTDDGDFGDWNSDVTFGLIDNLGLEQVLGLDALEGVIGSSGLDGAALFGEDLGLVLANLDFGAENAGDVLGGFSLGTLGLEGGLADFLPDDILGLFNTAQLDGLSLLPDDNIFDAISDLPDQDIGLIDPDRLHEVFAGLQEDLIEAFDNAEIAAVIDGLGANYLGSGAASFEELAQAIGGAADSILGILADDPDFSPIDDLGGLELGAFADLFAP